MSNLFHRQLSQGDQVNLQSPLAMASLNNHMIQQKPMVQGFSPSNTGYNQNNQIQYQNNQLTSLTNASSEASLMESTQGQYNGNIPGVSPFNGHQQQHQTQQYNFSMNKENSSPIFYRNQQYSNPSSKNENQFNNTHDYINPTKLFTQEFINQNKQKFQQNSKSPFQVQHFNSNQNIMQQPPQNYDTQKSILARNDYFNSLKGPSQHQQQYLLNQSGFGGGRDLKENSSDLSSNQTLFEMNQNQGSQDNHYYSGFPSSIATPKSIQNSSNNNSNIYQNVNEKQTALSNINFKIDPLERPLSQLLENAISKAISQSERVVTPSPFQGQIPQQHRQFYQHQSSTPEILIEDFSQSASIVSPSNYSSISNNYNPRNPSQSNYHSQNPSQNIYNNQSNCQNMNNNNQNNSYILENSHYEHRPSLSPHKQQKSNLNNSTLSPNNQSRLSQREGQPRLTLVERQTLNNSSRSPSKSSLHINCKYPNGDNNKQENHNNNNSKKKGSNNFQLNNSQLNSQQPSLMRSKSNNSIVTQHPYLKKNTRNGSPPQNSTTNNQNSQAASRSKISNLDRAVTQRSSHKNDVNNQSQQSIKMHPHNMSSRRDASPNINVNKKLTTPTKQNQKSSNIMQKNDYPNEINQFIFHQQNVSTINPNQDIYEQQNYQQFNATPRSISNASLALAQNNNTSTPYTQQFASQKNYNTITYAPQSPANLKQTATPRTPLNTNSSMIHQQSTKSSIFPSDLLQMEQIITNYDVQRFLQRHFIVGDTSQRLICDSWHSIPLVYFIKLLITEFPEVLEDHQIGEALLTELKERIAALVQDDDNNELVNLFKLQSYTKTTGLLGLILKALKELSTEEHSRLYNGNNLSLQRTNSDIQLVNQQIQPNSTSFYSHQGIPNNFFENFKTVFQNSLERNSVSHHLQSKDVQNIMNIIQEFVEGLYRDMENEIYSKFNVEMRRMMVKFKETESMLKIVSDKVTDNYGLFSQEATQVKKIKQLQAEKGELNDQLGAKDLEIKRLSLIVDSLTIENAKLMAENDKLHEKCEKYLEFGMKNVQTLYENNLQDQYQQLVNQQKSFFEQQIKQIEEYKVRQSIQKKDLSNHTSSKKHSTNKSQNPHLATDASDTESCNLSYALMTLEDQSVPIGGFQSSSKIPQQAIKALNQYEAHQNQNAFKRNKTEGQTLEPVMMDNSQFFDSSDKANKKPNISYGQGLPGFGNSNAGSFVVNAATITGRYGVQGRENSANSPLSLEQAIEKLQSLIEILPLIREVRLFNYDQISNFLKYLYNLQMFIYQQVDYREQVSDQEEHIRKEIHITSIPMNKCWKKILAEHNNKDFFCSFIDQNQPNTSFTTPTPNQVLSTPTGSRQQTLKPSASSSSLTPTSKPDIFAMQKIGHEQQIQQISQRTETQMINSNTTAENRFLPNYLIINNQGIIDILIYVLNQHLQKIVSCERQNTNSEAKAKYFLLKMLIYLNILIISNNKNDILNVLNKFFNEIQSQLQNQIISDFVRDNNVLNVIFLSLRNINFANTQTVSEALQFLISFKQASSNYMAFIRQLSQETNMTILLQLLECQFDSRNIMMALNLIKNVSYSINFKENIQSKIRQVLDQIQLRSSDTQEKEIEDITKVIRSNISCGVNIRTISQATSQSNINTSVLNKQN